MFFSMGEVSEMFDVNPSLIRFWEKRFDVLKPKKNAKGNRLFTPEDIENLKILEHLGRIRAALLEIKTELGAESTDTEIVLRTEALAEAVNEALPAEAEVEMAEETEEVVVAEAEVSSSEERETPEEKGAEKPRYIEPTLFDF